MNNPLLNPFSGANSSIPFDQIKLEHFKPAIEKAIHIAKEEVEKIKLNNDESSFSNTIEAFERGGELINSIAGIFFNLNSANTNSDMQVLAQDLSAMLTEHSNDIMLDEALFNKIKAAYNNSEKEILNTEQAYLREKIYKSFIRNGANLTESKKDELKLITNKLASIQLKFGENVLNDTNNFEILIDDIAQLDGLPASEIEAAKMLAEGKGHTDKWIVNLDFPSYLPFMKFAKDRNLRKKLYHAYGARGFNTNDFNNESILKEIAELRKTKANILGYKTYADFVLEERMAKSVDKIQSLWDELVEIAYPKALEEVAEVQSIADELEGPNPIKPWDFSYYSEILRNRKFNISDELLKPYFKLENVIDGAFQTAEKLFDIKFKAIDNIDKYHKEVLTYEVVNSKNEHIALFYADFFPRESKRGGAWMTSYRGQNKYDNKNQRPIISIVCNFTKPTTTAPSLLTFGEVTTLFHEFGHALHGILSDGYYESLSGTSVFWDFVELPSQLMENWCYEPECLNLFAKHYETSELIPLELIEKIKASMNFLSAYQTVRQVSLGQLDMAWHNIQEIPTMSVVDYEKESGAKTRIFESSSEVCTSTAFSHIFAGGYAAGYYSYKWAEVLEADAFELFQEKGIFNKEVAKRYRENILSKGGTANPSSLYLKFRGKEPDSKALLKKSGLLLQN
ncbi:M3 family metallopeptidase [Crocinitomix catalasitica]|uniref:M3 family metallopeptidase n=1 Tax=Crocinitomix catalasitica TaxID=184607 RepID=UPI000482FA3A|nr:M3 family metallopeptidase [Crocinitomix catalasitica]